MTPDLIAERTGAPRVQAEILAMLPRRGEEWLSGKEMSARLFDDPLCSTLRAHIFYMRRKWGQDLIESHKAYGYRLGFVGERLIAQHKILDDTWTLGRFMAVA